MNTFNSECFSDTLLSATYQEPGWDSSLAFSCILITWSNDKHLFIFC